MIYLNVILLISFVAANNIHHKADFELDFPALDFSLQRDNYSCPDSDLGNLCDTECRVDYIGCRQECTEIYCENACVAEYSDCLSGCPCGLNCPNGCDGCPNELCDLSPCQDLDNNNDFKRCKKEVKKEFDKCYDECNNNLACINGCTDAMLESLYDCPCFGGCPQSCPFCSNYDCSPKEFIVFYESGAYLMKTDGTIEEKRYDTPTGLADYTYRSSGAVFKGEFFIFGGTKGTNSYKKIAKLNRCRFEELSFTLPYNHDLQNAAVTLQDESKVLLCFTSGQSYRKCQYFIGTSAGLDSNQLVGTHREGCVTRHEDKILAVGDYGGDNSVAELRDPQSGQWSRTTNFPVTGSSSYHSCLAVSDGSLVIGGYQVPRNVHLFKAEKWSMIGTLESSHQFPASIAYDDYIYTVGNNNNEVFFYDKDELVDYLQIESQILYTNSNSQNYPLAVDAKYDSCV